MDRKSKESERPEDTDQDVPADDSIYHEPGDDEDRVDKESADSFPASDPSY